jgi:hypothetical protein
MRSLKTLPFVASFLCALFVCIVLVAGVEGNTVDIKNLASPDANTLRNNLCLTSVNAPCPTLPRLPVADRDERDREKRRKEKEKERR